MATSAQRVYVPKVAPGMRAADAREFSWGKGKRRQNAAEFFGPPRLGYKSKVMIEGVAEFMDAMDELSISVTRMRATHLRVAVKVENAALAEVPVAKGAGAYWKRGKRNPKPPAGGLKRSIRSFATDLFGEVNAGGGRGIQTVSGASRSMTGEFAKRTATGGRGQRYRTVGGSGFQSAKRLTAAKLETGKKAGQYGAGKGIVPYAGAIHFGWNTRPNASKGWLGGPIKANPFLWRAAQKKKQEVLRVYEIDLKKMIREVGLK